jgi:hypothetical protein
MNTTEDLVALVWAIADEGELLAVFNQALNLDEIDILYKKLYEATEELTIF